MSETRRFRCCEHCAEDVIHDVLVNEHTVPCDCQDPVRVERDALRAQVEAVRALIPDRDVVLAAEASSGGWAHEYAKLSHALLAALDRKP